MCRTECTQILLTAEQLYDIDKLSLGYLNKRFASYCFFGKRFESISTIHVRTLALHLTNPIDSDENETEELCSLGARGW